MADGAGESTADIVPNEDVPVTETPVESTAPEFENEEQRLKGLATTVRDQDELEKDIGRQADQMLSEQADERDNRRMEKTLAQKDKLVSQVRKLKRRLEQPVGATTAARILSEIQHLQPQIQTLDQDLIQIQQRIDERHAETNNVDAQEQGGNQRLPGESQRNFLIRTGKITPFSKFGLSELRASSSLAEVMLDAEDGEEDDYEYGEVQDAPQMKQMSHRNLLIPGFLDDQSQVSDSTSSSQVQVGRKRRRLTKPSDSVASSRSSSRSSASDREYKDEAEESVSSFESDDDFKVVVQGPDSARGTGRSCKSKRKPTGIEQEDLAGVDDGNEIMYQARLARWVEGRRAARKRVARKATGAQDINENEFSIESNDDNEQTETGPEEWYLPHPTRPDTEFEGSFRIPGDIYPSLFDYQKTGVQWLCELYGQHVGGIIGDEMGLGKTIQIISFLAGLHYSKKLTRPIIVVTPATVMKQWVNEFHRWWPPLRVSILHSSGSGMMDVGRERRTEDNLEYQTWGSSKGHKRSSKSARRIVDRVLKEGHVLVTTYSGLQAYADLLIPIDWEYAVLDEGHKIRNPNASITIYCKELRTSNRVILSGTPMQNNLTELWSLFDFIFPMRLGTLVNFRIQFEIPIKQGGYANASNLQVETALKCAETLKDTISPYLLQRFKVDVAADLPKKSEQVLFCRLTAVQRKAYESFLASEEMTSILNGRRQALYGIDILRKICNHPDLQQHKTLPYKAGYNYGSGNKSGKMQVVKALLELWRDTGHKTLLFAQHRIMLDILEKFVKSLNGFNYRRMDGNTQIKDRQDMVDEFNRDPSLHVFLLTTKVGGLGVNLTGADRVIIYDPDWNPSTDVQARERAWRLGQKREVMIYRLMTAGTIEEKIYHRQIFKQILTNKILRDPKQRQTFQLKDLHDLFTLGDANEEQTETGGLFKGAEVQFDDDNAAASATGENLPTPPPDTDDPSKIEAIIGISRTEAFINNEMPPETASEPIEQSETGVNKTTPTINKDSRVLSTIFARSGVHSALEHDAIISGTSSSGTGKVTADPAIIAREARRVAAQAAKELQRAGEVARTVPVGTPTWTGTVGIAGRPDETPSPLHRSVCGNFGGGGRGGRGPSSTSVLANLAARQGQQQEDAGGSQPRGKEFLTLIRDYLQTHGGRCYTQMLIDHFNRFVNGSAQRTAEFKEMLKAIAVLDRPAGHAGGHRGGMNGRGGRGMWVLKKEFGGTA